MTNNANRYFDPISVENDFFGIVLLLPKKRMSFLAILITNEALGGLARKKPGSKRKSLLPC